MTVKHLNSNQIQAAECTDKHVCILASAGCGKTTVLVAHYLELLKKRKWRPSQIVVTTFSEKSASDIKQKILELFRESEELEHLFSEFSQAPISTLHGLAGRILRDSSLLLGLDPHFSVLDENQSASLKTQALKEVLHELLDQSSPVLDLLIQSYNWRALEKEFYVLLQAWPEWKERFLQPSSVESSSLEIENKLKNAFQEVFLQILERYESKKKEKEVLDFNDLEEKSIELLQKYRWVSQHYQKQWKAYLIDEFQDTSVRQDLLLSLLLPQSDGKLKADPHLAIVGDPKQSIYGFRGAKSHIFEKYQQLIEASGGMTVELNENYRSPSTVLQFVNALFTPAFSHYSPLLGFREMEQSLEILKSNEKIKELKSDDKRKQEAQALALHIAHLLKEGTKTQDIFLLFRSSTAMPIYLKAFRDASLPVFIKSGESLLERQEIQDLLHAMRVVIDPHHSLSWVGLLRSPAFSLSDEKLLEYSLDHQLKPDWSKIHPFAQKLLTLSKNQSPSSFVEWWLSQTHLITLYSAHPLLQSKAQNLLQFYNLCFEWEKTHAANLEDFLKEIETLIGENIPLNTLSDQLGSGETITFMTIHQSKGLDLPVVILPDLKINSSQAESRALICAWENTWGLKIPDLKPGLKKNLKATPLFQESLENLRASQEEEENRIFYVATTRSTQKLILGFLPSPKEEEHLGINVREHLQSVSKNFPGIQWISPLQTVLSGSHPVLQKEEIKILPVLKQSQILHFGVTQLESFRRFPLEYKERYIDQIPAESVGTVNRFRPLYSLSALKKGQILHQALCLYFKEKKAPNPREIILSCMAKHAVAPNSDTELELEQILSTTLEHPNFVPIQQSKEAYAEIDFRLLLPPYEIQGAIDCLYLHENDWKVVDYKTHTFKNEMEKEELAKSFDFQLKTYCLAASKMLGQTIQKAEIYFMIPNLTYSFHFKEKELEEHEVYLKTLMEQINHWQLATDN